MEIGSMTTLFREMLGTGEHIGYIESLTRIRDAGFSSADLNLCQICERKTDLHTDRWRESAEEIRACADRLGLSLPQCHLPFKSKKVHWKTEEDYAYYVQMLFRAVDVAAVIGVPWGVIHPERGQTGEDRDALVARNHREYDRLVEYALERGLNIAIENMLYRPDKPGGRYCADAGELADLIDSFGDKRVGACWDTGHGNTFCRDQWEPLHQLGERLHCTHIHDNRRTDDLHLLPWEGFIDWERVIGALRDIGYPGTLILETSLNYTSPMFIKDENARHAFAVMSALATL